MKGKMAVACFAILALTVGQGPTRGQGQSGSHAIVIPATAHDYFRLGPEDPIQSALSTPSLHREIALHHAQAPGLMRLLRDPALQTSIGPTVATTSGVSFTGVGASGYAPPDTNGAAGPKQYVQWVNVRFAAFDKATGNIVYGPANGNTIWSGFSPCGSSNSGDPIAQYDKQAGVWVMMQPIFSSPYAICVAVSTSSDWTSNGFGWYRYVFSVPNASSNFPDYPKLAVWPDGYYLSYNSFKNGSTWQGPQACVMDRASMLAGKAATMQCMPTPGTQYGSMLPSDLDGDVPGVSGTTQGPPAGSPNYYLALYSNTQNTLFTFHVDWSNPANTTLSGPILVDVSSFNPACGGGTCIPQAGTRQKLDSLADRLMYRLAYRNFGNYESLVVAHSVDPGNGTSGIRWYEIRGLGSSPQVYQQGTFAPDSSYRWMPSIAQDRNGDMAVGYSVSSSTMHPSISYTGRLLDDPLNTMQSESPILAGGGSQLPNLSRWGDYSSMSVDPTDDCTFWYTNEYLVSNGTFNWSTEIASFTFPGCGGTAASPDFSMAASPTSLTLTQGQSGTSTISVSALNNFTGTVDFTLSGCPASPANACSITPASVSGSGSATLAFTTDSSTAPGTHTITVTGTDSADSLVHSTTVTLTVNAPAAGDFSISASPGNVTLKGGGTATYTISVSALNGYTGTVNLSASGGPSGATYGFVPTSISNGSGSSTLTVSTGTSPQRGNYAVTIVGKDSTTPTLTHSTTVGLKIR
jgi:hypothetical protein